MNMLCEQILSKFLNTVLVIFDFAKIEELFFAYTISVTFCIISSSGAYTRVSQNRLLVLVFAHWPSKIAHIGKLCYIDTFISCFWFSFFINSMMEYILNLLFKYVLSWFSSNLQILYSGVLIAESTGLRGQLSLWFLAKLYSFHGWLPLGIMLQ